MTSPTEPVLYLILAGPGAVSLLSPESASVNSSTVIRSPFEPVCVRVLCSTFKTASLHPDCFDDTFGRTVGVVLSPFPRLSSVLLSWDL